MLRLTDCRNVLLSHLLVLLLAPPVFAIDFGVIVENETSGAFVAEEDPEIEQQNDVRLFVRQRLTEDIEALLRLRYRYTEEDPLFWDVDTAAVQGVAPSGDGESVVDLALGRTTIRDFSGALLSEQADLVRWGILRPNITVTAEAAYLGLRRNESTDIVLSTADLEDVADEAFFAPPRGFFGVEVGFPEQLGRQNLTVGALYQHDFRQDGTPLVNTGYLGAGLAGPLSRFLFYDLFGYFATGFVEDDAGSRDPLSAWYTGGGILFFAEEALFSRVQSRFVYASGDADYQSPIGGNTSGVGTGFPALTSPSLGEVVSPRVSNVAGGSFSYSFKPLAESDGVWSELQVAATGWAFFRPTSGPVAIPGTVPGGSDSFLGWETDLALRFRPFSDLALSLSGGYFRRAENDVWLPEAPDWQAVVKLFAALSI
jgi:hypothetical protein